MNEQMNRQYLLKEEKVVRQAKSLQRGKEERIEKCLLHTVAKFFKKNFEIEIYLIYNVVLVSGIQQSDSVTHTQHTHTHIGLPWWLRQ